MKVLVAVKRVVDFNIKVRVKADGSGVETDHIKMSMNPFDEIAVEEAIRLKEKGIADEVMVVSIGYEASQETLRAALALGADRALLVKADQLFEPLNIALLLQAVVEKEKPGLVILGKQAIDDDCNQTGQMLAGLLDWPQATFVSKLEVKDSTVIVTREVDAGLETISFELPGVITTDLRLNEPRYTSLPNIMKAKSKPLLTTTPETLGVDLKSHQVTLKVTAPSERKPGIKINSVSELLDILKVKDKVSE